VVGYGAKAIKQERQFTKGKEKKIQMEKAGSLDGPASVC
jgi:hypothetical protein